MSVYKRPGSEFYSYDFRCRGHRFSGSTSCTTKREAEAYEKDLKRQVRAQTADMSAPMTFITASTLWWEQKGQFRGDSVDQERYLAWLQDFIGRKTLIADISDSEIARAVAKRRGEPVEFRNKNGKLTKPPHLPSNATVNRAVCEPMRAILNRARKIWKQKVQDIEWKDHFLEESQERVREATPGEESTALAKMRDDYEPALRFAFLSGCRRAEIVGLQWSKVNFFSREFTVTGKGDRSRTLPMTEPIFALLWELKDHHPEYVFTYICRRPRKGQVKGKRYPITIEGFKTAWRRGRKRAGLVDFKFHDTRHTAATRLMRATGNLKLAQKLLGHTEIATTSRYAHVTKDDLRAGMDAAHAGYQQAPQKVPPEVPQDDGKKQATSEK
ncbi:tyrosine-type recombinase/integrase [Chelativorans oligotrophicus]|uniref:tyrosine-type recombinase/integrase n=1 Tax=Chelativorans oligotrophicus TaxID=449974 RepID=UPI001FE8FF63|nr:site-specific integrase [Chelativorans oligotrophicus]